MRSLSVKLIAGTCAVSLVCALSACSGQLYGTPRLVDSRGVVQASPEQRGRTDFTPSADTLDLRTRFQAHAALAAGMNAAEDSAGQMVRSGLLLARANCDDFFASAGRVQRNADIARDMVAPIISVLTGIVALKSLSDDDNDRYLKILSIGSSTTLSAISIVDQHFLFGADNIKEVRDLTFDALAAHEEALETLGAPTFEIGMQQLIDHQIICTPASILGLTKQAIQAGDVVADTAAAQSKDEAALTELARALGLVGSATPTQAAGLWALYQGGVAADNIPANLERDLKALGFSKLIVASVPEVPATDDTPAVAAQPAKLSDEGRAKADQVIAILRSFSGPTRQQFAEAAQDSEEGRSSLRDAGVELSPASRQRGRVRLSVH